MSGLAPLELWIALFQESLDRLRRVLRGGVDGLRHALGFKRFVHAHVEGIGEEPFRERQRDRWPRGKTIGPIVDEGVELARRQYTVHQPELGSLLRRDDVSEEGELLGSVHADQTGQEPRPAEV